MAPLRSHIFELFRGMDTGSWVSYWYGGRSVGELFYLDEFEELEKKNDKFKMNIALSVPVEEGNRTGLTGFIHQALHDKYLADHFAPEDCEHYICGLPIMPKFCQHMPASALSPQKLHSTTLAFSRALKKVSATFLHRRNSW